MGTGPNTGGVITFSQTAAQNATADSSQNWEEGMSPGAVNDSARAGLASIAKFRDDIAGSIVTSGSSNAYQISSNQQFANVSYLAGQVIAFSPHVTNTAGSPDVTLTLDGAAVNVPIRSAPNVPLLPGVLVQGSPYLATYNAADAAFYLQGYFGQQNIPIGASIDYWSNTAPFSNYAFMFGQAISRTAFARLFTLFGTGYGAGDGSTTFNIPDCRGRVTAGVDNMGGTAASRLTSASGMGTGQLSQVGGGETHTLVNAEIPAVPFSGTTGSENQPHTHNYLGSSGSSPVQTGTGITVANPASSLTTAGDNNAHQHAFSGAIQGGGGAHINVQPTIVCNKIMRIL